MEFFVVDAFSDQIFGGNQAGVVILRGGQSFPEDSIMRNIAAELKHSETAFVLPLNERKFELRFFTPVDEVPLCGHATISTFTVLRDIFGLKYGSYVAQTKSGDIEIVIESDKIWLRMPNGQIRKTLTKKESAEVYRAHGLSPEVQPDGLEPCVAQSGLADILLPVNSRQTLNRAVQNKEEVIRLSKLHNGVGVHIYTALKEGEVTAYCRNFAPLFGIEEESATGTSNAALTYYLYSKGLLANHAVHTIVQGEAMGRRAEIYSKVDAASLWIGGKGIVSIQGDLKIEF